MMEKLVVIINGPGGVGKDTFCGIVEKNYAVKNISSITPIKEIAKFGKWKGEKTLAARKLLSDLKKAFTEYNDLPNKYLIKEYNSFLKDKNKILFVHIREGEEIAKFLQSVAIKFTTILVLPAEAKAVVFGNQSDDSVENYKYDYYYTNNKELSKLEDDVNIFFSKILDDLQIKSS